MVDPAGKTETSKYDASNGNRLISQTDGTGATTTYGYDTSGFPYTVTDPNGDVTTTAHDVRGNESSTPDGEHTTQRTPRTDTPSGPSSRKSGASARQTQSIGAPRRLGSGHFSRSVAPLTTRCSRARVIAT